MILGARLEIPLCIGASVLRRLDISCTACIIIIFLRLLFPLVLLARPCKERSFRGRPGFGVPIHGGPRSRCPPLLQRGHQATDGRRELLGPDSPELVPQLLEEGKQVRVAGAVPLDCEIHETLVAVVVVVVVDEEGEGVGSNGFEVESVVRRDHLQAERGEVVDLVVAGAVTVDDLPLLPHAAVADCVYAGGIH